MAVGRRASLIGVADTRPGEWVFHEGIFLEYCGSCITPTTDMGFKPIIALFLGLVFQLAQVIPAAVAEVPCASHGESCCCDSENGCHCADRGDTDPKPVPAPFSNGETQKIPVARAPETKVVLQTVAKIAIPVPINAQLSEVTVIGYSGVRLSVAFCSFVM
jgi:hypothetical protein